MVENQLDALISCEILILHPQRHHPPRTPRPQISFKPQGFFPIKKQGLQAA